MCITPVCLPRRRLLTPSGNTKKERALGAKAKKWSPNSGTPLSIRPEGITWTARKGLSHTQMLSWHLLFHVRERVEITRMSIVKGSGDKLYHAMEMAALKVVA